MEPDSGWAVRAMDLGMAVGATSVEREACRCQLRSRRMSRLDVALLTQPGCAGLQQLRAAGAMGFMAGRAIFHHRRMLKQERAPPFRMTLVTGLVDRAFDQQLGVCSSMRVMATCAGHLPFS